MSVVKDFADIYAFFDASLYATLYLLELCHDGGELVFQCLIGELGIGTLVNLVSNENDRYVDDTERAQVRKPVGGDPVKRGRRRYAVYEKNDMS